MGDYSRNFSGAGELYKPGDVPPPWAQAALRDLAQNGLEWLRFRIRRALFVLSGYRGFARNRAVGGATLSEHLFGRAADVYSPELTGEELFLEAVQVQKFGAVGLYYNERLKGASVHVDRRKLFQGKKTIVWYRNAGGAYTTLPAHIEAKLRELKIPFKY